MNSQTHILPHTVNQRSLYNQDSQGRGHHGRGAISAPAGRFERFETRSINDGWSNEGDELPKLKTHLHRDASRTVINIVDSPDLGFTRSINPYRGCEHGCTYCYARPSHSYLGFSAGLDFETEIFHKPEAPDLLRRELASRHYKPIPLVLGSNTDCYQPVERELHLTRQIITVLAQSHHPLTIITKSSLVIRDIDLLAPLAAQNCAHVNISLTTLDSTLARAMEPRASAPYKRLKAMEELAKAGVPVTVMVAPMIPGLNDMEMERILQSSYDAGARQAHYTLLRLPYDVKTIFEEWLRTYCPDRADRVLSLIRQTRGGQLYNAEFSQRMTGEGPYADLLAQRFEQAKKKYGFDKMSYSLRTDLFCPPVIDRPQLAFSFD